MAMGKKNRKNFKFGMVIINRNDVFLDGVIFLRPNEILALPEKKKKNLPIELFSKHGSIRVQQAGDHCSFCIDIDWV